MSRAARRSRAALTGALFSGLAALLVTAACSDVYLYDARRESQLPQDRAVTVRGEVCTPGTNDIVRPQKILLALDASQSMRVTDPDGRRATAIIELFNSLPQDPEIHVSVMLFAGSTTAFLTRDNIAGFDPLVALTQTDRSRLVGQLLNFTNPEQGPNRDSTDFVKPLSDIYALINHDIAQTRLATDGGTESRARYDVIFLSDGHPTNDQDEELLRGDAVRRIRQLKDLADDVRVHTVFVFNPTQPLGTNCDLSPGGSCPLLIVNQDAERMQQMAELGGGEFRDFRNNEPINFLGFRFGLVRRTWELKDFVLSNVNAPAGSPLGVADTDGDGLTDAEELELGTDPLRYDTDGDGFCDGVEVHFARLGAPFDPAQEAQPDGGGLDPGCPSHLRGVDSDCDGLFDCDEQLIGTNALRMDSDDDGVTDGVEWQLGTQPASRDLSVDPDNDGVTNRQEVRRHTKPQAADVSALSLDGYRYTLESLGGSREDGSRCWAYSVDNVLLAPTLADTREPDAGGTGRGAGWNELYFSVAFVPSDDPEGRTVVRATRVRDVRYPVGGIKSPPDGVVQISADRLVDRCEPGASTFGQGQPSGAQGQ